MLNLKELETAVMFWAGDDPAATLERLTRLGVHCGQIGIPGDLDLNCVAEWNKVSASTAFKAGQQIVVFLPVKSSNAAKSPVKRATIKAVKRAPAKAIVKSKRR